MSAEPTSLPTLGMGEAAKQRLSTKLQILNLLDQYRKAHDYSKSAADVLFAHAWNRGELAADPDLLAEWPQLSDATLKKWRLKLQADGPAALAGEYGNRKGQTGIAAQPEVRDLVIGTLISIPHVRSTRVLEFLEARFRERADIELPSQRTLQRWIVDWKNKNAQTFTAVTNPDKWKNKFMSAFGDADGDVTRLNQVFQLDGTRIEVQLAEGRYVISVGIEVYSRRICILVTPTASSSANAQLLRKMLVKFGVPELVKTDQGGDYISFEMQTVIANLQIQPLVSGKFSPWEKPFVERCIKTFAHDLVEMLPGYLGHSVADAQTLRAAKSFAERLFQKDAQAVLHFNAEQFQKFCDDWCESRYQHRVHSELGKTPFEMATEYRGPIRKVEDERALDLLLAEVPQNKGLRTVQKKGIRLPEGWFVAPELERYIDSGQHAKQVHVRYLPDAGKVVVYDAEDFSFICIAELPELTGISRQEIAVKTRLMQRERVQAERAAMRAIARGVNAQDAAAEILRDNMREAGKLVEFPRRAEVHTTPALEAAAEAYAELNKPSRTNADLIDAETFAHEVQQLQVVPQPQFDSIMQRVYWIAEQSYHRMLSGEELDQLERWRKQFPSDADEMDEVMQMRHGDLDDMPADERADAERYRNQFPRLARPA